MLKSEDNVRNKYQFDNLPELVEYVTNTPRVWGQNSSVSEGRSRDWDLSAGYEGALRMARDGWEEGVRSLFALAATVPNNTLATKEYSVAGDFADVPRYLAGDPFNMVKRGKQRVPKPAMTIVSSIGANCNVTGAQIANYGAAIVALIDRLESRGVRVELLGCWRSTDMKDRSQFCASWTIKRAEDHLDLSAVAFGLGHPAMLRRLAFAVMERSPRRAECYHYGISAETISPADLMDAPEDALFIGGVGSNNSACNTLPQALAYAKQMINVAYQKAGHGGALVELEELDD